MSAHRARRATKRPSARSAISILLADAAVEDLVAQVGEACATRRQVNQTAPDGGCLQRQPAAEPPEHCTGRLDLLAGNRLRSRRDDPQPRIGRVLPDFPHQCRRRLTERGFGIEHGFGAALEVGVEPGQEDDGADRFAADAGRKGGTGPVSPASIKTARWPRCASSIARAVPTPPRSAKMRKLPGATGVSFVRSCRRHSTV